MSAVYSKPYKRYVVALLLVIYIFNRIDGAIFGILMESIKRELALSDTQLGFLAGPALTLFYATLGIPIARWADRSRRITIMSLAIALWSTIVTVSSAVQTFWQSALARVGVGVGEAGFSAVAQSVITDYHSAAERTRALAVFMLALPLGQAMSYLMGGWVDDHWGWRMAFIVAGVPGLFLALLMKFTVQEPSRGAASNAVAADTSRPPLRAVFATLWRRRALRHLAIAMTLFNLVWGMLVWKAAFFIRLHGMSTGELGTAMALVLGVGGGLGIWSSGHLLGLIKAKNERTQVRVIALTALLACPLLIAALSWSTPTGALLLLLLALVMMNFFFAPSFSLVQGLCPASMRATMVAILILFQQLFLGVIGLQLTGILSDAFSNALGSQGLRWAMIALTPASLWAAVHFWLAGRFIRQDLSDASLQAPGR
jgi:predicted MFS family arabinose efflux permease